MKTRTEGLSFSEGSTAFVYDTIVEAVSPSDATVALLRDIISAEDYVLDLGCGSGRIARPLAKYCRRITAIDVSTVMLDGFLARGVPDNVELLEADLRVSSTIEQTEVADVAIAMLGGLQYVGNSSEQCAVLENVRHRLRPGGTLIAESFSRPAFEKLIGSHRFPFGEGDAGGTIGMDVETDNALFVVRSSIMLNSGEDWSFIERFRPSTPDESCSLLESAGFSNPTLGKNAPNDGFMWITATA
ncbi:class I SAM-dependent DNA methyltransferase [Glutamicibacter ardleyensis]|uniref:class I SAM-dependent DNA methyltransferase n=1 Tax=Glutamicibacter ardleyensis TaxID=225894 RepID=UPI003FCEECBA